MSLTIDDLNGSWVASRGETIVIFNDLFLINGVPTSKALKFEGESVVGFTVYRVKEVKNGGSLGNVIEVVWQSQFSEDDQQRWTRVDQEEIASRNARMNKTLNHTAAIAGASSFDYLSDAEQVMKLNSLIKEWSIGPMVKVRSCDICPDATNRAHTGLAVEHVHYIATCIKSEGFKSRDSGAPDAHDVPVLVREKADSKLGSDALGKWQALVKEQPPFPPFLTGGKEDIYCSLGSGHFSQALNLFRVEGRSLWSSERYAVKEPSLRRALDDGIASIVLSADIPVEDRSWVAEMLNKTHGRKWRVAENGKVEIEDGEATQASQFVALSKVLDSVELGLLVRIKMGVAEVDVSDCGPDDDWHQLGKPSISASSDGNRKNGSAEVSASPQVSKIPAPAHRENAPVIAKGTAVRVRQTGRVGEVLVHDPEDASMSFKIQFADGEAPAADWFSADAIDASGAAVAGA